MLQIAMIFAACGVFAFDSKKWLQERDDDADLLRLKKAFEECRQKATAPAQNVVFPIENYPDGRVKSRLTAAAAQLFLDTGYIWGERIHVEQFKADGSRDGTLDAENCVVDRKSKTGWVDGEAYLVYGKNSVRGRGVYFALDRGFIKITNGSEVRSREIKFGEGRFK